MTTKKLMKNPAQRAKPRRAKPPAQSGAPLRDDFSAIIDMIADAKERGAFDPKNRPRTIAKPTVANTPGAPFARIVAGAKTEDQQLRALEAAAQREVALPADAFVVGEPVTAAAITYSGHPRAGLTHARHAYLAGNVLPIRADVEALGLEPLALREQGEWDPETEYWGEEDEPIEEWAKPIIARGKRPMFEMEQVLPGADPEDFDSDPIVEASELNAAGDRAGAR